MRWAGGVTSVAGMAVLAVLLLAGTAAFADLTHAPMVAGINRPFSARVWGMGGACTAVANDADALLANPAGVPFIEGQKAALGFVRETATLLDEMYGDGEGISEDYSSWGIAWAKGPEAFELEEGKRMGGGIVLTGSEYLGVDWTQLTLGGGGGTKNLAWGATLDLWGFGEYIESEYTVGVGGLYRSDGGFSVGLNWDNALATLEDLDFSCLSAGAAYQHDGLTVAVDMYNLTETDLALESELLFGAEYCFPFGLALRAGSANGNLTYGIGYQGTNWSLDYARVASDETMVVLPDLTFELEDEYHFVSLAYTWPLETLPESGPEAVSTVEVEPVEVEPVEEQETDSGWQPTTEW
jgi:hypothetical protein